MHIVTQWVNDPEFVGEYEQQETKADLEKSYNRSGVQWFFIEKKGGCKIDWIAKYLKGEGMVIPLMP